MNVTHDGNEGANVQRDPPTCATVVKLQSIFQTKGFLACVAFIFIVLVGLFGGHVNKDTIKQKV